MTLEDHNALIDEMLAEQGESLTALHLLERRIKDAIEARNREHGPQAPTSSPVIAHILPRKTDPGLTVRVEQPTPVRKRRK